MDGEQAHRHARRVAVPMFRRYREQVGWRLGAEGLDRGAALEVLKWRRRAVRPWPGAWAGRGGAIALNVPGNSQNAKFRGRLRQDASGGLLVSGVVVETVGAIMLPPVCGVVTLLTLGFLVGGALTVTVPPLVIGLVATPVVAVLAVVCHRSRAQGYDADASVLLGYLDTLLAPLSPQPLRRLEE